MKFTTQDNIVLKNGIVIATAMDETIAVQIVNALNEMDERDKAIAKMLDDMDESRYPATCEVDEVDWQL